MNLVEFRRLSGLTDDRVLPVDAPWDLLNEAISPKDWRKAGDLTRSQGFSDLSKSSPFKFDAKEAIRYALTILFDKTTAKTTYIKDPNSVLATADDIEKVVVARLTGSDEGTAAYGMFGFDNNDGEIYADGPEVFRDGEWGYWVTKAIDDAQNDELEKHPPKVKVSRIKGKTAEGWRIDVSTPRQHYLDAGLKAGEKKAAELAKKGIFPKHFKSYLKGAAHYPDALVMKWVRGPGESEDEKICPVCRTAGGGGCEMCSGEQD